METVEQGWICPLCGRVYAPSVKECYHCNNQMGNIPNRPDAPKLPEHFPGCPNKPGRYDLPPCQNPLFQVYCKDNTGCKPLNS